MKKSLLTLGTLALVGTMGLSIFGGCNLNAGDDLTGYVAVDINPSVEFITDADGIVTDVRAVNYDGEVVIADMALEGKSIDVAVELLTETAEDTGYLNEQNTDVSITVAADSTGAEEKLTELAEKGVKKASNIAEIKADKIKAELEGKVNEFKGRNREKFDKLSVAKLKIIYSIMEYDETFTVEEGVKMEMKDLIDLLRTYIGEFEGVMVGKMDVEFKERFHEMAKEIRAQIDALYGEEYAQKMALLRKLEVLEDKYEFEFEKVDDEEEILTQEMKTALNELIGDNEIVDLDGLEDYIENLEVEIETIRENVDLTEIQEQLKKTLEEQLLNLKKGLVNTLKPMMEEVHNEFKDIKHGLKERFERD